MISYITRRLLMLVPTLLGITALVFLMIHLVPGDPAQVMLGERASPERLEVLRRQLGLDRPLYQQFGRYLTGLLQGDLGRSIKTHAHVADELIARFPATLELTVVSMLLACAIGMTAGVVSASRKGSLLDYLGMTASLIGVSMPIFWLGLVLIILLALEAGLFPVSGRLSSSIFVPHVTGLVLLDSLLTADPRAFVDGLWHIVLPGLTLGTVPAAVIARMTRSSLLEVLGEDYVRTAWA